MAGRGSQALQRYWDDVRRYAEHSGISVRGVRSDPAFRYDRARLEQLGRSKGPVDLSPQGELARILERLGYRQPGSTHNVGDTPKVPKVRTIRIKMTRSPRLRR